jgi:hypothetical protein
VAVDTVVDHQKVERIPVDRGQAPLANAATVAVDTAVDRRKVERIPADLCRVLRASAATAVVDTVVERPIVDRIPSGRCQARQASAATVVVVVVDIVVAASQVEVPIQGVPCRARRAVAMEEVARGVDPRTVDRMEETPVAVPAADLQVAITATTK